MTDAIALEGLTKRFGETTGVFGLDLRVAPGQIFGFLGPNGAGKTTTIRLLLSYLKPDAGTARVFGLDAQRDAVALRQRIGYLPAEFNLYEHMTGQALLTYLARYRPAGSLDRAHALAQRLNIKLDGRIRHYSKGMKQKVALIQAMMHDPDLLILDEPSDGFDPLIQQEFHHLLTEARARGKTVFLSSHILSEVEQLCDQVAIIRGGKLLAVEGIEHLQARKIRLLNLKFDAPLNARDLSLPNATFRSQQGQQASFAYAGEAKELLTALSALPVADFTLEPARLEEIFLGYYESPRP
ncbi:ABC transporter ATP-binding protein [bacterium]|nr:ABC transporter ATP-binding protein [bacterium]